MTNFINLINRYIINDKAVIIFWDTGEKTIAKIDRNDKWGTSFLENPPCFLIIFLLMQ